jgi:tetratricopeptide (TPR) repeat protein
MIKMSGAIALFALLLLAGSSHAQETKGGVRNPSPRTLEAAKEHAKGTEQMLAGKYEEAIVFFRRAIDLNPDFAEAYYNLGVAYEKLGKHKDSVDTLKKAIQLAPENANAHYALGYACYELKRYKESIDAFERSLALKPGNAFARKKLGSAYLAIGYKEKAQEQYLLLKSLNSTLADELYREMEGKK